MEQAVKERYANWHSTVQTLVADGTLLFTPARVSRIYISGPMSGIDEYNYPLFHDAAAMFRWFGFSVLNPAEFLGGSADKARKDYMRAAVEALLVADALFLLPNWNNSRGAILEVQVGQELNLAMIECKDYTSGSIHVA